MVGGREPAEWRDEERQPFHCESLNSISCFKSRVLPVNATVNARQVRQESKDGVKKLSNQDKYFNAIFSKSTISMKKVHEQSIEILRISNSAEL